MLKTLKDQTGTSPSLLASTDVYVVKKARLWEQLALPMIPSQETPKLRDRSRLGVDQIVLLVRNQDGNCASLGPPTFPYRHVCVFLALP